MIDRRFCDASEVAAFRRYQADSSNTWQFVSRLLDGGVRLSKAAVAGHSAIGELETFFKNIGTVVALQRYGTSRFRISQVVPLFDDPDLAADQDVAEMRTTVHRYTALFMAPMSSPLVTLFECADVKLLLDGNKTALAAYLHSYQPPYASYSLPVYWLHAPRFFCRHLFE